MKKLNLLGTAVLCTIFLGCSAGSSSPDYSALLTNTEKQTSQSSTPSKPSESTLPLFKFSGNENYVSAKTFQLLMLKISLQALKLTGGKKLLSITYG